MIVTVFGTNELEQLMEIAEKNPFLNFRVFLDTGTYKVTNLLLPPNISLEPEKEVVIKSKKSQCPGRRK